jgi:hypothetical protein
VPARRSRWTPAPLGHSLRAVRGSDLSGLDRRRAGPTALLAAVLACGAFASPAVATTYCVGFERPGCEPRATAAQAFADAKDDDRIELGAITATSALASDRAIAVAGAGEGLTVLRGGLTLSAPKAEVKDLTVHGLELTGSAAKVAVEGTAELHGGATLSSATVRGSGGVDAASGSPTAQTVLLDLTGGAGLRVRCGVTLQARHVTLIGRPDAAVTTLCASSVARVRDSILWPSPGIGFTGPGAVVTDHSDYRAVAGRAPGPGDREVDPGFTPGNPRLPVGSPLLDAGSPEVLDTSEYPEDRAGVPRISDGNGDGVTARDPGAFELAPAAVPVPPGNLLGDGGAEQGGAWAFSGGFARERYGAFPFPSTAAGAALGAGSSFFAGGTAGAPGPAGSATQLVDVTRLAPEIDLAAASASLSGLLGGYRDDADSGVMRVEFLDPEGDPITAAELDTPAASERANVTTLLPRARTVDVPPLARTILVRLQASLARGTYSDAYFDNIALTVVAPGAPAGRPRARAKPFAGVRVLTAKARVDRKGRVPLVVACADATVGGCTGAVTPVGRLERDAKPVRLGVARVGLEPGQRRRVGVRLTRAARCAIRQRRRLATTVYTAVRDGQGITRTSAVPVIVRSHRRGR